MNGQLINTFSSSSAVADCRESLGTRVGAFSKHFLDRFLDLAMRDRSWPLGGRKDVCGCFARCRLGGARFCGRGFGGPGLAGCRLGRCHLLACRYQPLDRHDITELLLRICLSAASVATDWRTFEQCLLRATTIGATNVVRVMCSVTHVANARQIRTVSPPSSKQGRGRKAEQPPSSANVGYAALIPRYAGCRSQTSYQ